MRSQKPMPEKKVLSLYACRKLMPVTNALKYVFILGALFFQQASTITMLVIFASLAVLTISLDTFLKLSAWRCPHCKKVMPSDFYSRKTLETCPNCHAVLDFSKAPLFVPAETED